MRVVSMVPSWTETLVACGADVVGRTRFCVHPNNELKATPVVGGTKDVDWGKVAFANPDLLLLDCEENPKAMAEEAPCLYHATHVTSVRDLSEALESMAKIFESGGETKVASNLNRLAERWHRVERAPRARPSWERFPGLMEWVQMPSADAMKCRLVYAIWKNPWMAAAPGTFIASVLDRLGWEPERIWPGSVTERKYPEFELEELSSETDVLICSSEPFPFHRKRGDLELLKRPCAIVDGEGFSWFGVRSLIFLEKSLQSL